MKYNERDFYDYTRVADYVENELNGDERNRDDVKDALVEIWMDFFHLSDDDLESMATAYFEIQEILDAQQKR
jgi:hypothetical protein